MKLQNLNVVELNAQEITIVDGGELITSYNGSGNGGRWICHIVGDIFRGFAAAF